MSCSLKGPCGSGWLTLAMLWTVPAAAQVVGPTGGTSVQANPRTDPTDPQPPQPVPPEAGGDQGLTDIVVTANRRAQNLQDVSIAIQAITAESLSKAGITDVARIDQITPGLTFANGGNDAKIALRGANSNSTFADNTSIVGVFVDGVYKPRASQQTRAFFDVARLEVLRGPQGTLYGRNTLGGAINLYTNAPDLSKPGVTGSLDVRYARFNDLRSEAVYNWGISDDFGARLAVLTQDSDGWVKNLAGRNLGQADTVNARLSFLAKPSDDVDFTLRITHIREDGNPAGMFAIQGACRTVQPNGLTDPLGPVLDCQNPRRGSGGTPRFDLIDGRPGFSNRDKRTVARDFIHDDYLRETNITLEGNADLGPVGLKSITSYTKYLSLLGNDSDYSVNPHGREWVQENNESFSQELQLQSKWQGALQGTVGAYYSTDDLFFSYSSLRHTLDNLAARPTATSTNGVVLPVQTGTPLVSRANVINSQSNNTQFISSSYVGTFGELTLSLAHWLRVIGGVRYNHEIKKAINGNAAYVGSLTPAVPPSEPQAIFPYIESTATAKSRVRAEFNNTTWRAGVEADLADDILLYGTASTGFLSGVMNQNGTVTQPQKSRSFEGGLKSRFLDRRVELNLAVYDVRYSELATTFQIPNPANLGQFITLSSNGGVLKARGVELSGAVLPADQWRIGFGASYIDAEYGRFGINLPGGFQVFNGAVLANRFIDLRGERPPYTPEFAFSVATSYALDVGFGTITPQVQFRYSDSYFAHGGLPYDRSGFQPSFTQTDVRVGFSPPSGNFTIEAFVENIEDEIINQRTQTGGDGLQQANWGLPRIYGARAKFNF